MASTARLYTSEILGLATRLAESPFDPALPLVGHARSPSCGSTITLGLRCDAAGRIEVCGVRAQACAIGQASAAVFIAGAKGLDAEDIARADAELQAWLRETGPAPRWPGFDVLTPAAAFPARHGALRLPWAAALDALSPR